MAMRTATPWWLAWTHLGALLLLFVSQRFLAPWELLQTLGTAAAVAVVAATLGVRAQAVARTRGSRRRVERTHLLAAIGTALAIALFAAGTEWGRGVLGQDGLTAQGAHRWQTACYALAAAVGAASVLPIVMIEATLGLARRERFDLASRADDDAVEYRRVREVALSGLTVALAAGFLMATCSVAQERDKRVDVSYFKTSAPGTSTKAILKNTSEPIRVLLFFPQVNEVKDELRAYFTELGKATGKVSIEEHDLVLSRAVADQHKVSKEGAVVMVRGEGEAAKSHKFELDTDIDRARRPSRTTSTSRPTLRSLDGAVNAGLMQLVRDKRKVYLTVGHGEINDPDSLPAELQDKLPDAKATVIKSILQALNYEAKNIGLIDGLGNEIPEDATMVLVLGPRTAFLEDELATLDRYLARGGNLLIAMDPRSDFDLGPLERRLGVRFDRTSILDDKNFVASRGPRFAITNQFSSHASITSLSKAASNEGILLLDAGSLEEVDLGEGEGDKPRRTHVIRTMQQAFRDLDGNGVFTEGLEKRDRYVVATAIEGGGDEASGFRAMVFADADLFVDRGVQAGGQIFLETWGGPMPADAIKWVGGEEVFSGEITSENDVEINQTQRQDSWWFLLTIIGAPLIVLGGGLLGTRRRRRPARAAAARPAQKTEEKSS
jgi:hypothetical protein